MDEEDMEEEDMEPVRPCLPRLVASLLVKGGSV